MRLLLSTVENVYKQLNGDITTIAYEPNFYV